MKRNDLKDEQHDDAEHFEFIFLWLFKIKCRRVNTHVLIALAMILIGVLLFLKMVTFKGPPQLKNLTTNGIHKT